MALKIRYRLTTAKDYNSITKLLSHTDLSGKWFTDRLFRRILTKNKGLFWVAERNHQVVGSVFASHDGGYFGYMYKMVVHPDFRRNGIAEGLLDRVMAGFKRANVLWYFAHVHQNNIASRLLLQKKGFKILEEHQTLSFEP